jgi:hypothetical protein
MTLLNRSASATERKCLALVQNIVYQKKEQKVTLRIFPKNLHEIVACLTPSSTWEVLRIFSLTTVHREYTAITQLPMLSLSLEILRPNFRKHRPEKEAVERVMLEFQANRPQAEAIVSAVHQKTGFILIQGYFQPFYLT